MRKYGDFKVWSTKIGSFLAFLANFIDILSQKNLKSQKYLDFYVQKYLGTIKKVKNGLNNNNYG